MPSNNNFLLVHDDEISSMALAPLDRFAGDSGGRGEPQMLHQAEDYRRGDVIMRHGKVIPYFFNSVKIQVLYASFVDNI